MSSSDNPSLATAANEQRLTATYKSPSSTHTFSRETSQARLQTPQDTTAYLARLGGEVAKLQDEVNAFLTAQMEAEKAGGNDGREVEEEKNYGEEADDAG